MSDERISENHGQLTLSERDVLPLRGLSSLSIQGSDALFEAEERLVDLCSFCLSIFIVAHAVLSSLTASQVDKVEFGGLPRVPGLLGAHACDFRRAREVKGDERVRA